MKENPANIFFACPEHSSKPNPAYAKLPPEYFLKKYVKKCFSEIGTERKEHLWILVKEVKNSSTLIGIVDNDPALNLEVKFGDKVEVLLTEIEEIYL